MGTFLLRRLVVPAGVGIVVIVGTLIVFLLTRDHEVKAVDEEKHGADTGQSGGSISVKTVFPRQDKHFQLTVERPADVEAYFRVTLEARVAGEVKSVRVAPGSWVEKDQPLVEISVPDLQAGEKEKASVIRQRERELQLARAKAEAARFAVKTSLANVEEKKTLLTQARALTNYRQEQFERLDGLWSRGAVDKNVRDEANKNLKVAQAGELGADAARIKAEAEVEDARANVSVMEAEVERSKELIEVARGNHDAALALVNYAMVKAPFRGMVVHRHVDPGSFVQNASTGHPNPVLTMERTDILTVVMRVPDNVAQFVTPGTEADIQVDSLPGVTIRGKVTRFSRTLENAAHDRTMRVEVDLWNGTAEEYKQFVADPRNLRDLKEGPLPLVPEIVGKIQAGRTKRLMAGRYGKMTLVLHTFGHTCLIPSQALLRQGGRTFIYVIQEGKAHRVPVEVQLDDGNMVKVVRLGEKGEVICDLTGKEEVVVSNQDELSEGQAVKTSPMEEWKDLKINKTSP